MQSETETETQKKLMFVKKTLPRNDSNEVEKLRNNSNSDDNWDSDTIDSILNSTQTNSRKGMLDIICLIYTYIYYNN